MAAYRPGLGWTALGSTRNKPEETMVDVLRAATLLAAVLASVWLYNSVQTGSVLQLTGAAQ